MKKIISMMAVLMLLLFSAGTAFAGGQQEKGEKAKDEKTTGDAEQAEPTTLEVWHYFADSEGMKWITEEFNSTHSDIKVNNRYIHFSELENQITKALMSEDTPDVVIVDGVTIAKWAENGAFAPITDRAREWGEKDNFYQGAWETGMYNGELYSLPQNINTLAMFYNKDLFEEAGVSGPPETWAEMKTAAKKISALGDKTYGLTFTATKDESGTFQFAPFVWQAGADFLNIDTEEGYAALGLWQDMVENGYASKSVMNTAQYEMAIQFASGNHGMMVNGPWALSAFAEDAKFDYGAFTMPVKEGVGEPASVLGGENIAIMKGSEKKDAAWEFVKFFEKPSVIEEWCKKENRIPARKDVVADNPTWSDDEIMQVFSEQLKYAKGRPKHPEYPKISTEIQNAIQKGLTGTDVQEALDKAASNIDSIIE